MLRHHQTNTTTQNQLPQPKCLLSDLLTCLLALAPHLVALCLLCPREVKRRPSNTLRPSLTRNPPLSTRQFPTLPLGLSASPGQHKNSNSGTWAQGSTSDCRRMKHEVATASGTHMHVSNPFASNTQPACRWGAFGYLSRLHAGGLAY